MIGIFLQKHSTDTEITPPPPLPPVEVNEECVQGSCGENAHCKVQKVLELLCMQLLQGIVRGQPDCECKEGCAGDPFTKCDCSGNIFNLDHLQNSKYFHMLAMLSQ